MINQSSTSFSSPLIGENISSISSTPPYANENDNDPPNKRKGCGSKFCHLMDTWPITFVLIAAAIGIGVGVGLSTWNPEDTTQKDTAILWIGLLGELFIRGLKCIVLPLVFVSIAISFMGMLSLGKAGKIVGLTIGLYVTTTVCASLFGVLSSIIFSRYYNLENGNGEDEFPADIRIGCTIDENDNIESYLTEQADGSISCMVSDDMSNSTVFRLEDINGYFETNSNSGEPAKLSLSESLYQGLFMQLVDDNMVGMFVNNNFLGVIVLGAAFGVALTRLTQKMPSDMNWDRVLTIQVLEELLQVFMMFVVWIIKCTPFAVVSLIASAIGAQSDITQVMTQIGYLVAAISVGMVMQVIVVYFGGYLILIRQNPIIYFKKMIPAYTLAFASASSAATLPQTLNCAIASGIPKGIARFCLPLGATVNMDGASIYIICSCVWLAYQNGIVPSAAEYILLIFCSTLGSMGAAPVPASGIVLIITTYTTTFGSTEGQYPSGYVNWLIDRLATMSNIAGDLAVTAVVSNKVLSGSSNGIMMMADDDEKDEVDTLFAADL